jgi:hypothetical protein
MNRIVRDCAAVPDTVAVGCHPGDCDMAGFRLVQTTLSSAS